MDQSKQLVLAAEALIGAIVLGVLGDLLLRDSGWGVGFAIFIALVICGSCILYRHRLAPIPLEVRLLAIPIFLFSLCFALHDTISLRFIDAVCIGLLVGVAALRRHRGNLTIGSLVDYPCELVGKWFEFFVDFGYLANLEGQWPTLSKVGGGRQVMAVGRGVLIAAPLLIIFGGLFMSADASFEHLITGSFSLDPETLWENGLVTIGFTWMVGGFFRRMFLAPNKPPVAPSQVDPKIEAVLELQPKSTPVGMTEVTTVLGMLILLFAVFVGTQIPYFFGSAALAKATHGINVATWARRGFFELATVSGLALPVLVGAEAIIRGRGLVGSKLFNTLATVMIGLLLVVMASAAYRMQVYVSEHGVTLLRIYVIAIIAWLVFVFGWFIATVLRGQPQKFAWGSLVSLLAAVFALNVFDPEGFAARIDMTRSQDEINIKYLVTLGVDAVPPVIQYLDRARPDEKGFLEQWLKEQSHDMTQQDWRGWSLSTLRAQNSLRPMQAELDRLPAAQPETEPVTESRE